MRPELSKSCIEFDTTPKYSQKPPKPATFIFILDLTASAIKTGYLNTVASTVKSLVSQDMLWAKDTNIGFIGMHKVMELIDLTKSTPHIYTLHPTMKDMAPIPLQNLTIQISDCKCFEAFLNSLPTMFNFSDDEICLNEALCVLKQMTRANGGKALLMMGAHDVTKIPNLLPTLDAGNKDGMNKQMLRSSDYYQQLAQYLCIEACVSVDIFAFGNSFMVATLYRT